ncbi:MAG: UDP-N-acetylmuramoyl-L-alanyl-D-glutamate--2,6-diaminopimelate ligase [Sulfuricaulis sp.]|uniref:UDP-N-acetylmuramoyl-L-alanyl-D-glutamate--2, 6-diaminopimelate ligase n=1 Tax=Sulfuricaulis sp. TaxID=2003553 RepID=UPI0034A514C6
MTSTTCYLSDLLHGLADVSDAAHRKVHGLKIDSRKVKPGDMFIAMPGMVMDGREFIGDAVASGAVAVLYEKGDDFEFPVAPVPVIAVPNLRQNIGFMADRFYGAPTRHLVVVGVTGTNGKTTCTHLMAQALDQAPTRCALIGTLGSGFPDALNTAILTTPDAITVHCLMAEFLAQGATHVAMEVSSHALHQGRVRGVAYDVAVFTNLTRDHLDYHGDMAIYGQAKAGLFALEGLKHAVINHDDDFGRGILARLSTNIKTLSYGIEGGDIRASNIRPAPEGLAMNIGTPFGNTELRSPLIGRFNVYNLLAVLATLLALGMKLDEAVTRLARAQAPTGRAQKFGGVNGLPLVVVDYAHTPDALEKILLALREHTRGKLWCVFGCGGDRDRGKRPVMGEIAERLADVVVLTDDNPRHESGDAIIADIHNGMRTTPRVIRDRRTATAEAIRSAGEGDIVLIAGKGHEDYQQIGDERLPYSDRLAVHELLGVAA